MCVSIVFYFVSSAAYGRAKQMPVRLFNKYACPTAYICRICWCCVQGHSAAVKEAVGASLLGCKAPFRLVQDHSRSGRLEASVLALRKWLFSEHFDRYLSLVQVSICD